MRNDADLAVLALRRETLDTVRDEFGGRLRVSEGVVRQGDPADVEAGTGVWEELDVGSVRPRPVRCGDERRSIKAILFQRRRRDSRVPEVPCTSKTIPPALP